MESNRVSRILALAGVALNNEKASFVQENSILLHAVSAKAPALVCNGDASLGLEISSWLSLSQHLNIEVLQANGNCSELSNTLSKINEFVASKTFLVGGVLSLADIALFDVITLAFGACNSLVATSFVNVCRYIQHIGHVCGSRAASIKFNYEVVAAVTVFPLRTKAIADSLKAQVAEVVVVPAEAPAVAAKAKDAPKDAAAKEVPKEAGDDKKKGKKEKKGDAPVTAVETSATAAAAAAAPAAATAATAAPASAPEGVVDMSTLDPSRLDIRVGRINKCWNHPDSTKLLCEEVDVGDADGTIRTIASGLREYYTAEEMVGKYVVVLCNLKERAIAGFKSQGMVLCAVAGGHSDVILLAPSNPDTVKVGDKVSYKGFNASNEPPLPPNQVAKKKIFEGLVPFFHCNAEGQATWNNVVFELANGGHCRASGNLKSELGRYAIS